MESSFTNLNYDLITEMAEGDKEFESQLLEAMVISVTDLKHKYALGLESADEEMVSQARHKIKPSLELFGLSRLEAIMGKGKELIETLGIGHISIAAHREEFLVAVDDLLSELTVIQK